MAVDILKNVHYFLGTVLPNASSSQKWNAKSIDRAFQWAGYCEQVYENGINKPQAKELDACIRKIGAVIEKKNESPICFKYLKVSTKVLLKAFMQNIQIESKIFQLALEKGKEKGLDIEKMLQEVADMKSLCVDLIEALKPNTSSINIYKSLNHEIEAELLLEHVQTSISDFNSQKETEDWLLEFLRTSCDNKNKMLTYLHVLLKDASSEFSDIQILQTFFLNWLLQRTAISSTLFDLAIACELWKQPLLMLRRMASKYFSFYKCYIDILVKSTSLMVLQCEQNIWKWELKSSTFGPQFTFTEILSHFKSLCSLKGKASKATKNLLQSLNNDSKTSPIWKEINSHVEIYFGYVLQDENCNPVDNSEQLAGME